MEQKSGERGSQKQKHQVKELMVKARINRVTKRTLHFDTYKDQHLESEDCCLSTNATVVDQAFELFGKAVRMNIVRGRIKEIKLGWATVV